MHDCFLFSASGGRFYMVISFRHPTAPAALTWFLLLFFEKLFLALAGFAIYLLDVFKQ
jgi:hypothetical protein